MNHLESWNFHNVMYLHTHIQGSDSCASNYVNRALASQMQAVHQFISIAITSNIFKDLTYFKEPDPHLFE